MKQPAYMKTTGADAMMPGGMASSFPPGLKLTLDAATLKKLGVDDMPKAGASVQITGKAKVTTVTKPAGAGGGEQREMTLQITHLAIGGDTAAEEKSESPTERRAEAGPAATRKAAAEARAGKLYGSARRA
jgi:hypothetical protein